MPKKRHRACPTRTHDSHLLSFQEYILNPDLTLPPGHLFGGDTGLLNGSSTFDAGFLAGKDDQRPGIPTGSDEFPLPEQFPTANEDKFPLLIQSDATAEELCAAAEVKDATITLSNKVEDPISVNIKWYQSLVIKFGDSYEAPKDDVATGSTSEGIGKKKGRTVALTTEDMQKRKNDVKARTTLLLALPDEHQLRFSKYKTAQELWDAILKTFGEIEQDDLNQKFLTSLAPKWLMHMIVWRNRSDLDTMNLDDLYNYLKVYEPEVQKKSESNSQNMAFISSAKNSSGNEEVNNASIPTASIYVSPASANIGDASISQDTACAYIKKTWKKISIQGTDVAGFDKSKVECFNCHKMGHFARECRAPKSQDRGKRDNYRQRSKVEEQAPKALMAINRVGWDWNFMANEEENHALVADEEAPTEFALMAKTSAESEVFDNSLCSKTCKKNTESLNSKITDLTEKLSDSENMMYYYKLGLSHVEGRLVEFKKQEIKFCEKIKCLEFSVECKTNRIKNLTNELETLKKEKEGLESKLTVYSPPKKDMSWTGLPEFVDDTITDYIKHSPSVESNLNNLQNSSSSASENRESTGSILSKPEIKFVRPADSPTVVKIDKKETVRKPTVKYAELYRKTSKRSNVRGN
nr:hypothetical protein [Tanacetum cinerariifolium]